MKKIIFLSAIALIACSCAVGVYEPWARNNFGAQTTVVLDRANFRVVRNVEAVVEVNNSNLKRYDVEKSAYAELLRNAHLTGSQVLTNVVIEEVIRAGSFSRKQFVAARATIIEFLQDNREPVTSAQPAAKSNQEIGTSASNQTYSLPQDTKEPQKNLSGNAHQSVEQDSELKAKAESVLEKSERLINYYKYSGKHFSVFKAIYKEVEQGPTEQNVEELDLCYFLLRRYHTDQLDFKDINAQLKKANDVAAQKKILIDEARKQMNQ